MNQPRLFEEMEPAQPKKKTAGKRSFQPEVKRVVDASRHPRMDGWVPDEIPHLNGERRIILNCETNGFKWWVKDRPIGWAYWLPESGRCGYLPIRHVEGNLPIEQVHTWLGDLKDIHIENHNTRFDLHHSREDGVDLIDETGNTFGDSMHYAALLDDNRRRFKLDELSSDILGWNVATDELGTLPAGVESEGDWWQLPSWAVRPYALRNCEQVVRLIEAFEPEIEEQNLGPVLELEQSIIPVVVEIEKNGVHLDLELLHSWQLKARSELEARLYLARQTTGVNIESPDGPKALEQVFRALNLPIARTAAGAPSFTGAVMKQHFAHPVIKGLYEAGQLADLLSKYLDKYARTARASDGWMRHNLHQLKAIKEGGDPVGTISGRFSAAGDRLSPTMRPDQLGTGGYNPQQAVAVEKQLERGFCPEYVVRRLVKPAPGYGCYFAADMMQVEYRLFAHYAKIAGAFHAKAGGEYDAKGKWIWTTGPLADFHALVAKLLNNPKLNRKLVKNINFAMIYGAGLIKFALMLGYITDDQFQEFTGRLMMRDFSVLRDPALAAAADVRAKYLGMFPAVKPLLDLASDTSKNRGYVCDYLGRRARITNKHHSALNRVIQGGAATYNKRVIVEVYKRRKDLGLRMELTMHDELAGSLMEKWMASPIKRVLNHQWHQFDAPILWDAKTGDNWAACK